MSYTFIHLLKSAWQKAKKRSVLLLFTETEIKSHFILSFERFHYYCFWFLKKYKRKSEIRNEIVSSITSSVRLLTYTWVTYESFWKQQQNCRQRVRVERKIRPSVRNNKHALMLVYYTQNESDDVCLREAQKNHFFMHSLCLCVYDCERVSVRKKWQ